MCRTSLSSTTTAPSRWLTLRHPQLLKKPEAVDLLKWTGRVCRARGWRYEVWTGGNATELANVRFLSMAKRSRFVDPNATTLVGEVAEHGMTIDRVLILARKRGNISFQSAIVAVSAQLWNCVWVTDLRVPLSESSAITFNRPAM